MDGRLCPRPFSAFSEAQFGINPAYFEQLIDLLSSKWRELFTVTA
jgi:hypothetical protein